MALPLICCIRCWLLLLFSIAGLTSGMLASFTASSTPLPPMASRRKGRYAALPTLTLEDKLPLFSTPPNNRNDDWTTNDGDSSMGANTHVVNECRNSGLPATESKLSATTNIAKCICGAGSFALPHVFLEEGIIGGTLALTACGFLATNTMQSLARSKQSVGATSYVELAQEVLGPAAANTVFFLTLSASLGVCSSYIIFIGQTLESLSSDVQSTNMVRTLFPDVSTVTWEVATVSLLFPLTLLRSYKIFAFTSALGVLAVLGGLLVTLASGIVHEPGGGLLVAVKAVGEQRMWPESLAAGFGESFGTLAFLFCVNFLTFPIMNSMERPKQDYDGAVANAVVGAALANVVFAALCVGFYGENTADLVLSNLGNGPFLSALKLLLCVDLLFTFPIVFSSGRQIMELALIGDGQVVESESAALPRAGIAAIGVLVCLSLAQIGGFGVVVRTNLRVASL
jgi:amino acid permease